MRCCLRTCLLRNHRIGLLVDHILVKGVLYVWRRICLSPEALSVGFVVGEEQLRLGITLERVLAQPFMGSTDDTLIALLKQGFFLVLLGLPGVAEPEGGENMKPRRLRAAIVH